MGQLEVAVLGTPQVRHGGVALTFPTRKGLAIFVYLTVEGWLHAREKLAALFWPESDHVRARGMLRYTLTGIRQALEAAHDVPHLLVERGAVGVDMTCGIDIDLARLRNASEPSRSGTLTQLREVVRRCQGEFLEGFTLADAPEFDAWVQLTSG